MRQIATILAVLLLLFWPAPARAQEVTPQLAQIPGLLNPIELVMPWQCGDCSPGAAGLEPWPDPDPPVSGGFFDLQLNPLYPFQWLAVQLWNNVAYPIICWMLATAQGILNAAALAWNTVAVNGVNGLWRAIIVLILWTRDSVLAFWSFVGWLRGLLWSSWAWLMQINLYVAALISFAGDLVDLVAGLLVELVNVIIGMAQALSYLLGLFMAIIPAMLDAILNPVAPPQLDQVSGFFLWEWTIDILRAIQDSKLGWAWVAFIVITYGRFGSWLLDELGELNT
jgi:hypothetical protein